MLTGTGINFHIIVFCCCCCGLIIIVSFFSVFSVMQIHIYKCRWMCASMCCHSSVADFRVITQECNKNNISCVILI